MNFFLLINIKMPTIVGILTFISKKNSILGYSEPETNLNFLTFSYLWTFTMSSSAELSMKKSFITTGPGWKTLLVCCCKNRGSTHPLAKCAGSYDTFKCFVHKKQNIICEVLGHKRVINKISGGSVYVVMAQAKIIYVVLHGSTPPPPPHHLHVVQ